MITYDSSSSSSSANANSSNEVSSGQSENEISEKPTTTSVFEYQPPKLVKKLKTESQNDKTTFTQLSQQTQSIQNIEKQPQILRNEDEELSKHNQISSETNPVGIFHKFENTNANSIGQSQQQSQQPQIIPQINSLKGHLQQEFIQQASWLQHWEAIKRTFMETKQEEEKLDSYELDELSKQMAELSLQNKQEIEEDAEKRRITRRIQAIKERLVPPSFCEMLTDKQLTEVCAVFDKRGNTSELVVKHSHILQTLSYGNFQTLFNTNWLNDEIVNAYATLIQIFARKRVEQIKEEVSQHNQNEYVEGQVNNYSINGAQLQSVLILSSFIYPIIQKKEFTKLSRILTKNNVSENSLILLPMNIHGNHWIFVEINLQSRCLVYYDSLLISGQLNKEWKNVLQEFKEAFEYFFEQQESQNSLNNGKSYNLHLGITGKQQNGYDCGVFMLRGMLARVMDVTARNSNNIEKDKQQELFDVTMLAQQAHMLFYRYQIAAELIEGVLTRWKQ